MNVQQRKDIEAARNRAQKMLAAGPSRIVVATLNRGYAIGMINGQIALDYCFENVVIPKNSIDARFLAAKWNQRLMFDELGSKVEPTTVREFCEAFIERCDHVLAATAPVQEAKSRATRATFFRPHAARATCHRRAALLPPMRLTTRSLPRV